jgi:hypothetical protein
MNALLPVFGRMLLSSGRCQGTNIAGDEVRAHSWTRSLRTDIRR